MVARTCAYALVGLACCASETGAQEGPLSVSQAFALARERAPVVVAARGRLAQARAELVGASLRPDNPEIDASAGPRFAQESQRQLDFGVGVSQIFNSAARRRARSAAANAAVTAAEAGVMVAQREALRDVSVAFVDAHFLQRHHNLLRDAIAIAVDALQIAERRFALGDVAALDVNTARVERARLEAEAQSVEAQRLAALGTLGALLGTETVPSITADMPSQVRQLDALLRAIEDRPELRAVDAEITQAEARLALASASKRPVFGASARYERDEGDHVVLGGLTVTLPVFNQGQDISAEATARIEGLRLERAVLARSWAVLVRARMLGVSAHQRAIELIERDALPAALDNEGLARRSYETGQISLIEWMVLRREAMQVRREHLDRLRDIAIAGIELDAMAGVIQ